MAHVRKQSSVLVVDDPWMTVTDAAEALGLSRFLTMKHAMRGALVVEVHAGHTVISRDSVEKLRRQLQKAS